MDKIASSEDIYLFNQGENYRSYFVFGAHPLRDAAGIKGINFLVWAPQAQKVSVVGDFNSWCGKEHSMKLLGSCGVWSLFIPDLAVNSLYKYEIETKTGAKLLKADPFAFYSEVAPKTASIVYDLDAYSWQDQNWQREKSKKDIFKSPMLIYEINLESWKHKDNRPLTYRELADELIPYLLQMEYTHVEFMPLTEYPFAGSWGYQATGYFASTSRYGTPADFMYLVDSCHQKGIGVILDWVPGHFCKDDHGLRLFDGTPLFEHPNPLSSENRNWGTLKFNFEKKEVWSFLISSACFWLDKFHIDGFRVDAVASMLYLDYEKKDKEWLPNKFGGKENLEVIAFFKKLNEVVFHYYPNTLMIAEESTAWPMVTSPTYLGGLGFNYKWNMGWMNDLLKYMELDPIYRKYNHNLLTFSLMYAFSENYILPLSHDEVVHGKKSLLNKMPGDYWQKFANLRLFYSYWMTHPGKKLLFMGGEFGQFIEWRDDQALDWDLLDFELHAKLQEYLKELNNFYHNEKSLWELDHSWDGFKWIDPNESDLSILSFMRLGQDGSFLIVICNFTPEVRSGYRLGVPEKGKYKEVFNSDRSIYGGSNQINENILESEPFPYQGQDESIMLKLPPLGTVIIKPL